jgi:hypothetical protein
VRRTLRQLCLLLMLSTAAISWADNFNCANFPIYCDGPSQGPNGGTIIPSIISQTWVSDSFNAQAEYNDIEIDAWLWVLPGDTPKSFEWSITDAPNGGHIFGEGTAQLQSQFLFTNHLGYDVYFASALNLNVDLKPGDYWLTLQDAKSVDGQLVGWEENDGVGCNSPGCPSMAFNAQGQIGPEAFQLLGQPVPEPASFLLLVAGGLGLLFQRHR